MSLSNRDIAEIFERCADMLQIRGDNIHRVLSYRRASETIRSLPRANGISHAPPALLWLWKTGHIISGS